ncbi:unnamed protein product, partial [Heterosigma akashiwo]
KCAAGTWSKEEHSAFLEGLEKYGKGKWKQISKLISSRNLCRNSNQVRSHAQKYFLKKRK